MRISSCVPLPGDGVIARYGALVAVTAGPGLAAGPLLDALAEVAAAGGDGSDLVRTATRAALGCPGQPAWACAGVTADGAVAVLVHGGAVAAVSVAGGPGVILTASDSVIPVSRTFSGETVSLSLTVGEPGPADPRCRLGDGVVPGAGLAVTVSATVAGGADTWAGAPPAGGDTWVSAAPAAEPSGWHPPTVGTPAGAPAFTGGAAFSEGTGFTDGTMFPDGSGALPADAVPDEAPPVLVEGALCAREHLNDPRAKSCRQCGPAMEQPRSSLVRRPRPPLGVLLLDDGTRITLDSDYVLGREPVLDGDVMAGRARPLRISDPEGTVSRLHLRISLVGWQVEVSDLGSANGSVLQSPGGDRTLAPFESMVLDPGASIGIGHRSIQYLASQGVLP